MTPFKRADGDAVQRLSPVRRVMPSLMPTRNGAAVYFEEIVDVSRTLVRLRQAAGRRSYSLFEVLLAAAARTLVLRPQLNRFVAGGRLYQRRGIQLSYVVKKAMTDEATMTMVKLETRPSDTLADIAQHVRQTTERGRDARPTSSEREMQLVSRVPPRLVGWLVRAQRLADGLNLLPAGLTAQDPLYASMVVANVGSLGLESAYHHLYEHGTASLFVVVGRVRKRAVVSAKGENAVRDTVSIKVTLDERIADGYYCARSMELFRKLVQDPTPLLATPDPTEARPR